MKKYPNYTNADLELFVLGMQSRDEEVKSLKQIILKITNSQIDLEILALIEIWIKKHNINFTKL